MSKQVLNEQTYSAAHTQELTGGRPVDEDDDLRRHDRAVAVPHHHHAGVRRGGLAVGGSRGHDVGIVVLPRLHPADRADVRRGQQPEDRRGRGDRLRRAHGHVDGLDLPDLRDVLPGHRGTGAPHDRLRVHRMPAPVFAARRPRHGQVHPCADHLDLRHHAAVPVRMVRQHLRRPAQLPLRRLHDRHRDQRGDLHRRGDELDRRLRGGRDGGEGRRTRGVRVVRGVRTADHAGLALPGDPVPAGAPPMRTADPRRLLG